MIRAQDVSGWNLHSTTKDPHPISSEESKKDHQADETTMRAFQRPFLGEHIETSPQFKSWVDTMSFKSSPKFASEVDSKARIPIERMVLLSASSNTHIKTLPRSIVVRYGDGKQKEVKEGVSELATVEHVTHASVYGDERGGSNHVSSVWKLVLKNPSVLIGKNWEVEMQW